MLWVVLNFYLLKSVAWYKKKQLLLSKILEKQKYSQKRIKSPALSLRKRPLKYRPLIRRFPRLSFLPSFLLPLFLSVFRNLVYHLLTRECLKATQHFITWLQHHLFIRIQYWFIGYFYLFDYHSYWYDFLKLYICNYLNLCILLHKIKS